jgi:hypothetical protein
MAAHQWTEESKAKYKATRAATVARRKAEQEGANMAAVHSIPLEAIPDDKPKKPKKVKGALKPSTATTKEQAVLEIIRLTMWLAQN